MILSKEGSRKSLGLLVTLLVVTGLAVIGKLSEGAAEAVAIIYGLFVAGNGAEHFAFRGARLGAAVAPEVDVKVAQAAPVTTVTTPAPLGDTEARFKIIEGALGQLSASTKEIGDAVVALAKRG